jgi:hypothetical protein
MSSEHDPRPCHRPLRERSLPVAKDDLLNLTNSATHRLNGDRLSFCIAPAAPFPLDFTAWALRRRTQNKIDRWDGTTYRRVLPFDGVPIEVATGKADDVMPLGWR